MNLLKNKIVKALNNNNYVFIQNRIDVQERLGNTPRFSVVLYNVQNLSQYLKKDLAYLMEGTRRRYRADQHHAKGTANILSNPVAIENNLLCSLLLEYHRSYVVYDGYLFNNKLILTNNYADAMDSCNDMGLNPPEDFNNLVFVSDHDANKNVITNLVNAMIGGHVNLSDNLVSTYMNGECSGPSLDSLSDYMANGLLHNILLYFLGHDIVQQSKLYRFKGMLAWLSTYQGLNSIYSQVPFKGINKDDIKPIISQVIYLLIINVPLFKFINHDSILSKQKHTINLNSGLVRNKLQKVNLQPVNNDKFINQLIRASDPHMAYCSSQPIRKIVKNINIKINSEMHSSDTKVWTQLSDKRGFDMYKKATSLGNNSVLYPFDFQDADFKSTETGFVLTNTPSAKVILSNHTNAYKDIGSVDTPFVYNEYKLNQYLYMTIIQPDINKDSSISSISILVPNLVAYMYPAGVTLHNYRLNVDRIIKYGTGTIVNDKKYILLSTYSGEVHHCGPVGIRLYKVHTDDSNLGNVINRIKKLKHNQAYVKNVERGSL